MQFVATIKLLKPSQQMRRESWPGWIWLYLQPVRGQLMFMGMGIKNKYAFDTLCLEDTRANDWYIREK